MRQPMFSLQPADAAFLESAPLRLSAKFDVPLPANRVWADLTSDNPLGWCRLLGDVTWTSARPFGVGTTRTVRLVGGSGILHEEFFRWEEGRRKSFFVTESTAPLFRRFAEDYLVEPTSESSCRWTWTIAVEARQLAKVSNPVNRLLLATLFRDSAAHYGLQ